MKCCLMDYGVISCTIKLYKKMSEQSPNVGFGGSVSTESSDGSHSSGGTSNTRNSCQNDEQIAANVINSEIWDTDGKKFTIYKLRVSCSGKNWQMDRRYTDFRELNSELKRKYPSFQYKLPGKKLFGNNFKTDFIRSRKQGLDDFIQKVLGDPQLNYCSEVRSFLGCRGDSSGHSSSSDKDEEPMVVDSVWNNDGAMSSGSEKIPEVDLGPSEKIFVKPTDFEFLKVIGKGSFGKVMLARHKSENKTYAVKVLNKKMILKRNEKTHIMCERNVLLKNLNHPFLVGLHYSFQTRDKLYFVLDYLNGGELFFHLQRETNFVEARARFYAAEITSALGYLHSQGIVYRDLKPENILLDADGHVVLTDFGLCKDGLRERDTTTTFCGTPEYLAPEVLRKEAYDRSVDWWCLGAVLYEMLHGLPPFYSRDTSEMYDNILHKEIRLRTNISLAARSILDGLLQKDKRKRLGAMDDVEEVKRHEFFKLINWHDLETKNIHPPFNPNVKGCFDLKNIDPEFTREPVSASVMKSPEMATSNVSENAFQGFSYHPQQIQMS